jgi:hypothetical protein
LFQQTRDLAQVFLYCFSQGERIQLRALGTQAFLGCRFQDRAVEQALAGSSRPIITINPETGFPGVSS